MMVIHFNVYADFLAAVKEMKELHVLWQPASSPQLFGVTAYLENKHLIASFADTSQPASFAGDFPDAVSVTLLPYLNPLSGQQF